MKIQLKPDEQKLREFIEERVEWARNAFEKMTLEKKTNKWVAEAGEKAHLLHMSLKNRGVEPKHHGYMIKNRGMASDHKDFYFHFHPLEDLLEFLDDSTANNDPMDVTVGQEFHLKVYTRRWGHDDTYRITRTANGWNIRHSSINGDCDKTGHPILFLNLKHDSVIYPVDIGSWFQWLWVQAAEKGLSAAEVQQGLDELSQWIKITETNIPKSSIWKGYAE